MDAKNEPEVVIRKGTSVGLSPWLLRYHAAVNPHHLCIVPRPAPAALAGLPGGPAWPLAS